MEIVFRVVRSKYTHLKQFLQHIMTCISSYIYHILYSLHTLVSGALSSVLTCPQYFECSVLYMDFELNPIIILYFHLSPLNELRLVS